MANSRDFYTVDDALKRYPWCLVVPTIEPDDPNIIGPFTSVALVLFNGFCEQQHAEQ
jgi:hypothetical protein